MLVLDSLSQYLLYRVEPPSIMPFHDAYIRLIAKMKDDSAAKEIKRKKILETCWRRRMAWYEMCFVEGLFQPCTWHHLPFEHPGNYEDHRIYFTPAPSRKRTVPDVAETELLEERLKQLALRSEIADVTTFKESMLQQQEAVMDED